MLICQFLKSSQFAAVILVEICGLERFYFKYFSFVKQGSLQEKQYVNRPLTVTFIFP